MSKQKTEENNYLVLCQEFKTLAQFYIYRRYKTTKYSEDIKPKSTKYGKVNMSVFTVVMFPLHIEQTNRKLKKKSLKILNMRTKITSIDKCYLVPRNYSWEGKLYRFNKIFRNSHCCKFESNLIKTLGQSCLNSMLHNPSHSH